MSKLKTLPLISLSCILALSGCSDVQHTHHPLNVPTKGIIDELQGTEFADKAQFVNDMDSGECFSIKENDKHLGWAWLYFKTDKNTYVFKCTKEDTPSHIGQLPKNVHFGTLSWEVAKIEKGVITPIDIPYWEDRYEGILSPTVIGEYLAYWALKDNDFYVVLFDLNKKLIIEEKFLSKNTIAPGHGIYFMPPTISDDGKSVIFDPNIRGGKGKVLNKESLSISLPNKKSFGWKRKKLI